MYCPPFLPPHPLIFDSWAFVDFTSTEHATAALTNPRNHQLNGRKLVVEYASPEAVRRGGGGPPRKDKKGNEHGGKQFGAKPKRDRPRWSQQDAGEEREGDAGEAGEAGPPAKRRRSDAGEKLHSRDGHSSLRGSGAGNGKGPGARPRSKPGAALAMAKREDVSIVPSEGKKIVF